VIENDVWDSEEKLDKAVENALKAVGAELPSDEEK
jgi:hypothetical protein